MLTLNNDVKFYFKMLGVCRYTWLGRLWDTVT